MSEARWCDFGNHPFKAGRQGTLTISQTVEVPNQWGGHQAHTIPEVMEICPEHAESLKPPKSVPETSNGEVE